MAINKLVLYTINTGKHPAHPVIPVYYALTRAAPGALTT
jgi:hypothetical protein